MITSLIRSLNRQLKQKALVLMYHRVLELEADVWRTAVSPSHFEQQLQMLRKNWQVIPLPELVSAISKKKLKKNSIALTFDDGYADNFLIAKPLLEKYELPATFFVSSGNIGQQKEFWWDELLQIILFTENLPQILSIQLENLEFYFDLKVEKKLTKELIRLHDLWKAYEQQPVSLRCTLFLKLWEIIRPLQYHVQQQILQALKNWAGCASTSFRPLFHSMTVKQIQELGQNNLFHIGAHTVSHPDLKAKSALIQQQEILSNKAFLEEIIKKEVNLLAYPYGRYNEQTLKIAAEGHFKAAFTTNGNLITSGSEIFLLGRFLADNWNGIKLDSYLKTWFDN